MRLIFYKIFYITKGRGSASSLQYYICVNYIRIILWDACNASLRFSFCIWKRRGWENGKMGKWEKLFSSIVDNQCKFVHLSEKFYPNYEKWGGKMGKTVGENDKWKGEGENMRTWEHFNFLENRALIIKQQLDIKHNKFTQITKNEVRTWEHL